MVRVYIGVRFRMSISNKLLMSSGEDEMPRGESFYVIPGSYSWTCPEGVTSVSVVCIGGGGGSGTSSASGGGGLGYINDYPVTPGNSYNVAVGEKGRSGWMAGGFNGGDSEFINSSTVCGRGGIASGAGGTYTGDGGGNGSAAVSSGGGAAGGYSGDGNSGTGGAGAGGTTGSRMGGGGVGAHGEGTSGTPNTGQGGSGGQDGYTKMGSNESSADGGLFGGAGSDRWTSQGAGGCVRIIWPGDARQFPSTDVDTP